MILLDTHVLIWWVAEPAKVSAKATRRISAAIRDGEAVAVSSISIWEIAMLVDRGRLTLTMDVESWIARIEALPFLTFIEVDNAIAVKSVRLEGFPHRDPADRMIIATALTHGADLVTADAALRRYSALTSVWD